MVNDHTEYEGDYFDEFVTISFAVEILSSGSKKSALKKLNKTINDRKCAKSIIDKADEFLKHNYGPKYKKLPKEAFDGYIEQLYRILEAMKDCGYDAKESIDYLCETFPYPPLIEQTDEHADDSDPIFSPLCQPITHDDKSFDIHIFCEPGDREWTLQITSGPNSRHCWNHTFRDDQAALKEAKEAIPDIVAGC